LNVDYEHRGLVKIVVDKISRLNHEVDTAREDFKVFLNGLQRKGTSTDVVLCILYEAVNIFENIVKEEVQKADADKEMSTEQFLDLIKEKALKNSGGSHNWLGRSSV
jgi:hypothetical protein